MNPDEDFIGQIIGVLFVALVASGFYLLAVQLSLAYPILKPLVETIP